MFYSFWLSTFSRAAFAPTWFFLLFCRQSVWSWWTAGRRSAAADCPTRPEQHKQIQLAQHTHTGSPTAGLQDPPPLCSMCVSSELAAPGCRELGGGAPLVCHWPPGRYWWKWLAGSSWIWGSRQRHDPPTSVGKGKMKTRELLLPSYLKLHWTDHVILSAPIALLLVLQIFNDKCIMWYLMLLHKSCRTVFCIF